MAHVRRKFVDIFKSQGLEVAEDAIKRIALLYGVEKNRTRNVTRRSGGPAPEKRQTGI